MLEIIVLRFGILMLGVVRLYFGMQEEMFFQRTSYCQVSFVYTLSQLVDQCVT